MMTMMMILSGVTHFGWLKISLISFFFFRCRQFWNLWFPFVAQRKYFILSLKGFTFGFGCYFWALLAAFIDMIMIESSIKSRDVNFFSNKLLFLHNQKKKLFFN